MVSLVEENARRGMRRFKERFRKAGGGR